MDNFWTFLIAGFKAVVEYVIAGVFPPHLNIGLSGALVSIAGNWIAMLFMVVTSYVNLAVPAMVFIVIGAAEGIRGVYTAWRIVLKAIPTAG